MKKISSLIIAFLLFTSACLPIGTFAVLATAGTPPAVRISNPDTEGLVDGIDPNPLSGIHNSYAWCAELFEQDDGDYLWVGTNRDLGGLILFAAYGDAIDEAVYDAFGIPQPDINDLGGKIYRYKMDAFEPKWELVWDNPVINGYRKMVIFNGDLYVMAGITNRVGYPMANYSLIYRFPKNFKKGDAPQVVKWETLVLGGLNPGDETPGLEYYRAASVIGDYLYIGTGDGKVWRTDGSSLRSLTPRNFPLNINSSGSAKNFGWELVSNLAIVDGSQAVVWDVIGFGGKIYAFVSGFGTSGKGFRVYKLTQQGNNWLTEQIVGNGADALYPAGIGLEKHVAASPFLSTSFDKDYVYVTSFADGPSFLGTLAVGNMVGAFGNIYQPAALYRFDENDNWEVVVGDADQATDSDGLFVPHVGSARAGFFPGSVGKANFSSNQYIWWMTEHDGTLFASTWDMGVFRQAVNIGLVYTAMQIFDDKFDETLPIITQVREGFKGLFLQDSEGAYSVIEEVADAITEFTDGVIPATEDLLTRLEASLKTLNGVDSLVENLVTDIDELLGLADSRDMLERLVRFVGSVAASAVYLYDESNPAGFDLFYTEDGVNFLPYTVSGLGEASNYGGRVVLSTEKYGLFIMTANPSKGCQVWQIGEVRNQLISNTANTQIRIKKGEDYSFKIRAIGVSDTPTVQIDNETFQAQIQQKETLSPIVTITPSVEIVADPTVYGGYRYVESTTSDEISVFLFEVTLESSETYKGDVEVTVTIGDITVTYVLDVNVYKPNYDWILWVSLGGGAIVVAGTVTAVVLVRRKKLAV